MSPKSAKKTTDLWKARCLKKWLFQDNGTTFEHICRNFAHVTPSRGEYLLRSFFPRWDWHSYIKKYRSEESMAKSEKLYQLPPDFTHFTLNPVQLAMKHAIENYEDKNILVVAPTAVGKTLAGEMGVRRAVDQSFRALWLSPLKADTKEKYNSFRGKYDTLLDTGDNRTDVDKYMKRDWDVSVMTYERCASILSTNKKRSVIMEGDTGNMDDDPRPVDVVVIDEIHNIGSHKRGPVLESAIIDIMDMYPDVTIIGISATIGNPKDFADWLDAILIHADESQRPVPLKKFVHSFQDNNYFAENDRMRREILTDIILNQYPDDQFFVFVSSRARSEDLCKLFLGIDSRRRKQPEVKEMIRGGFGFHHAGVRMKKRERVEQAFRDGEIRVIFCTPTLAQGVDFNVDGTIAYNTHWYSYLKQESEIMSHNEFIQMGGRAGRQGKSTSPFGHFHSICLSKHVGPVVMRMDESMIVTSKIFTVLDYVMLRWFVNGTIADYKHCLEKSDKIFNYEVDPGDEEHISPEKIESNLNWLIEKEFLSDTSFGELEPTYKGRNTVYMMVMPKTTQHWFDMQDFIKNFNKPEHIFTLLMGNDEFMENIVVRYSRDQDLINYGRKWLKMCYCHDCNMILPFSTHPVCPSCGNDKEFKFGVHIPDDRILKAFAMVFKDEIQEEIRQMTGNKNFRIKVSPTDRSTLKREVNRLMAACVVLLKECPDIGIVKNTALLANAGTLDVRVLELLEVPGIGMTYATRLVNIGILTVADLIRADLVFLCKVLMATMKKVKKLVEAAKEWYSNA